MRTPFRRRRPVGRAVGYSLLAVLGLAALGGAVVVVDRLSMGPPGRRVLDLTDDVRQRAQARRLPATR